MSKIQHDVMLRVVKILNVLMIELPFAGCWFLYYSHQTYANLAWEGHFAILGLFFILYIAVVIAECQGFLILLFPVHLRSPFRQHKLLLPL